MDRSTSRLDEALAILRQAVSATDDALSTIASLDQLQERFEDAVVPHIAEPDVWAAAQTGMAVAKENLFNVRACLDEMLTQITRGQAPEAQTRAWADQFVDLNMKLQATLTAANQQTTRLYETMRPTLVAHYLENATHVPRWAETWPFDAEEAARALERIAAGEEFGGAGVEELDLQLAKFRWDVGWPQQKMAVVVGLSQPSVAARLSRIETLINLSVGSSHVRAQAKTDGFVVARTNILPGRPGRGPVGDLSLESEKCFLELDLLIGTGDMGTGRRQGPGDRGNLLDYLRWETNLRQPGLNVCVVRGAAVYFRDRGIVSYYTAAQVAEAVRHFRNAPADTVLQQLRMTVEPARTLTELVQRAQHAEDKES